MATSDQLVLAGDFPPATREMWLDLAAKALQAGSADAALAMLRSTSYDGITIEPLYTRADAVDEAAIGLPGTFPLVRGRTPGAGPARWDVRQAVDASACPGQALEELERGATSLWLESRDAPSLDVAVALDGVLLDVAPVVLAAGNRWRAAATALADHWEAAGVQPATGGSLGADPLGAWASARDRVDPDAELAAAATWAARLAADAPGVRAVTIDGRRFHDAGASDAQELGLTLAVAVATLRALDSVDDPFAAVELRIAVTADQFSSIAKVRAARQLWARVAEVAGAPELAAGTPLHAVTSTAMLTRYDPAVNMLRATVACFAAGIAGADAVTVLPYDAVAGAVPSALGRRLACNTQSVLAMESHLAEVTDPAGGSWYVEQLTAATADAAWSVFQEVEAAGGFRAAIEAGLVAERIAEVRARRDGDIDHRRAPLTGLSEYPNTDESPPAPPVPAAARDDRSLPAHRWSERFETLRARVDDHISAGNARPRVYLATLGAPADFTARLSLAANFYGIAGLATVHGPVAGFASSRATVACVCSSDAVYDGNGAVEEAVAALTSAGATRVDVAGRGALVGGGDARAALAAILEELQIR